LTILVFELRVLSLLDRLSITWAMASRPWNIVLLHRPDWSGTQDPGPTSGSQAYASTASPPL
jgi:hypothetical protein